MRFKMTKYNITLEAFNKKKINKMGNSKWNNQNYNKEKHGSKRPKIINYTVKIVG